MWSVVSLRRAGPARAAELSGGRRRREVGDDQRREVRRMRPSARQPSRLHRPGDRAELIHREEHRADDATRWSASASGCRSTIAAASSPGTPGGCLACSSVPSHLSGMAMNLGTPLRRYIRTYTELEYHTEVGCPRISSVSSRHRACRRWSPDGALDRALAQEQALGDIGSQPAGGQESDLVFPPAERPDADAALAAGRTSPSHGRWSAPGGTVGGAGDVLGQVAGMTDVDPQVTGAVQDEHRQPDARQDGPCSCGAPSEPSPGWPPCAGSKSPPALVERRRTRWTGPVPPLSGGHQADPSRR